ncbi:hypothetical protein BDV09DRAFT_60513 [Aspergillus tetrazonus]
MTLPSLVNIPLSKALNPSPSHLVIRSGITIQTRYLADARSSIFFPFLHNSPPIDAHSQNSFLAALVSYAPLTQRHTNPTPALPSTRTPVLSRFQTSQILSTSPTGFYCSNVHFADELNRTVENGESPTAKRMTSVSQRALRLDATAASAAPLLPG